MLRSSIEESEAEDYVNWDTLSEKRRYKSRFVCLI